MNAPKKSRSEDLRTLRWPQEQWELVGRVAKALGTTRSEFVRDAVMASAARAAAGLPYSVIAAQAATQNTAANPFSPSRAQQEEGKKDSRRSRTRLAPEVISGPILEKLGRDGVSNGASKKAGRLRGLRS